MRYCNFLFLLIAALLCQITPGELCAQHQTFKVYTRSDGLIHHQITRVHQDSTGFLWLATTIGLNIFDGNTFTRPLSPLADTANPFSFFEKSKEEMWVGTRYKIEIYRNRKRVDTIQAEAVFDFLRASDGRLLTAGLQGIYEINNRSSKCLFNLGDRRSFTRITESSGHFLAYLWEDDNVLVFDKNFRLMDSIKGNANTRVSFQKDVKGEIWVNAKGVIRALDTIALKKGRVQWGRYLVADTTEKYDDFLIDKDGYVWLSRRSEGIRRISTEGLVDDYDVKVGLPPTDRHEFYEDNEGNIWSTGGGLIKFYNKEVIAFTKEKGLLSNSMYNILEHKPTGTLWSVHKNGLSCIKGNKAYRFPIAEVKDFPSLLLRGDTLIIGAESFLYYQIQANPEPKITLLRRRTLNKKQFKGFSRPGNISFDNKGRLFFMDLANDWTPYWMDQQDKVHAIPELSFAVNQILPVGDILWVGAHDRGGIREYKVIETADGIKLELLNVYLPDELIAVRSLVSDQQGNFWIGTWLKGLYKLEKIAGKNEYISRHYSTEDGLSGNYIRRIIPDGAFAYYIFSASGLDRIIERDGKIEVKKITEGFSLTSEIWGGVVLNNGNDYALATFEGALLFKNKYEQQEKLPILITRIEVNGNPVTDSLQVSVFPYNKNNFRFQFISPVLRSQRDLTFEYRLTESDVIQPWLPVKGTNLLSFPSLPPGNYRFEVRVLRNDVVMSQTPASYVFTIKAPLWGRWWFWPALIALAALITFVMVRRRIEQIRTKEREKADFQRRIAEERLMALRAQLNPHFIFNCLNNIDGYVLNNEPRKASTYLAKFSRLTRNLLDNSVNDLIPLEDEVSNCILYMELERMRFNEQFDYDVEMEDSIAQEVWQVPPTLFQPFLENAILHGLRHKKDDEGLIQMQIVSDKSKLTVTIEDNGVGRKEASAINEKLRKGHKSMGMQIMRDRIQLHNAVFPGKIQIETKDKTGNETGTVVVITILKSDQKATTS